MVKRRKYSTDIDKDYDSLIDIIKTTAEETFKKMVLIVRDGRKMN